MSNQANIARRRRHRRTGCNYDNEKRSLWSNDVRINRAKSSVTNRVTQPSTRWITAISSPTAATQLQIISETHCCYTKFMRLQNYNSTFVTCTCIINMTLVTKSSCEGKCRLCSGVICQCVNYRLQNNAQSATRT